MNDKNEGNKVIYNSPTKKVIETPFRSALKGCNYDVGKFLSKMKEIQEKRTKIENLKPSSKNVLEGKENVVENDDWIIDNDKY